MEPLAHIILVSAGPFVVAVITLLNARRINAQWRERRAARQQSDAERSGSFAEGGAH